MNGRVNWSFGLPGLRGRAKVPSGPGGTPGGPPGGPDLDGAVTVVTYSDYVAAQHAVDHLSDSGFPVEHTNIVGTNLSLVENVLGRLTTGRAALAGAGTGAWFGLFIGLLFAFFAAVAWWVIVIALVVGAFWGALFGAIAHAMTRGRRDFSSSSSLQASEYAVMVDTDVAERARELLSGLRGQPSSPGS